MNLVPFLASFLIIGLAELGDKTQLLTIALASKFPMDKVIYGVVSASSALMLLAVLLGQSIHRIIPPLLISVLASAFFIIYGLSIVAPIKKGEDKKSEKIIDSKSIFFTVFGSFFIAELGDKTQLATFALAAKYNNPLQVWFGATLAMIVINLFGIAIGNVVRNYLPEKTANYLSGVIFIIFGVIMFLGLILKM